MTLELSQKNKNRVRFSLYLISACFILFFISGIFNTVNEIDKHILSDLNNENKDFLSLSNQQHIKQEINLNNELGGYILKIALNIIQIVFLVNLMVLLLIYEINEKRRDDKY